MTENNCRIICASAGTGKTYRLSLEYISLILQYYGTSEFSPDNILVLTFTRKATAEIRERIVNHLELLLSENEQDLEKQNELLKNLRELREEENIPLSDLEKNLLFSARKEIICDQSRLQVMTIDSYTGQIFRNIVRPLRNIERYNIDTEAVKKIMPFLFNHLMKPDFRNRLQRLLSRKVSRSLDDYTAFFLSLINQRWLYYLITRRQTSKTNLQPGRLIELNYQTEGSEIYAKFLIAMQDLIKIVADICSSLAKAPLEDYFNKDFRNLVVKEAISPAGILQNLKELDLDAREKLLMIMAKNNVWNKQKISEKKYGAENIALQTAQKDAQLQLADYLILKLYLPEQQEIMEIWSIILAEYDRLIYRYKNLTYNDVTWFTFETLFSEEPPFLNPESAVSATEFYQFLTHRTRFLLIDEFQDTSLIQFNVLKPIIEEITAGEGSKPFGGVIVVGDEKQSIFGWRGGERDLLLNLKDIFPALKEVEMETLKQSFRCGPTLMEFVNQVFNNEALHKILHAKEMKWNYSRIESQEYRKEEGTEIEFCLHNASFSAANKDPDADIYTDFVKRMVIPALEADSSGSIAVLCRTNEDLRKIQQALDISGTTSLFQPNRSIIEYHLVAPLLSWLRFLAWGDWIDFIAFLRSDYVLINTDVLKQTLIIISETLAIQKKYQKPFAINFSALPLVNEFYELALSQKGRNATDICREIIDICLPCQKTNERDYLNLQRFLDIVSTRLLTEPEKGTSLPDLLTYLTENAASEDFTQVSVNAGDGLQLLSFHKSKGLQFKRVFVFYNFSTGHRDSDNKLSWALDYEDKTFNKIKDFCLSLHYQKILALSSYADLYLQEQKRNQLEEMNNLYVAFTRAEQKLHLYFNYQCKDGWDFYYNANKENKLVVTLCEAVNEIFINSEPDERGIYTKKSCFKLNEKEEGNVSDSSKTTQQLNGSQLKIRHSRPDCWDDYLPAEQIKVPNLKNYYLLERPNLIGDLMHYYMSFIIRNEADEHKYAWLRCLNRYGSIFVSAQIGSYTHRCQNTCQNNPFLFAAQWDKIFTEQEILWEGKLMRIDRLMINTAEKEALIADYKSGDIYDSNQLLNYKNALLKLPALQGYKINTQIVVL